MSRRFEGRFRADRMAQEYLSIYNALPGVQGEATRTPRLLDDEDVGIRTAA
jgi:hypothetical protein